MHWLKYLLVLTVLRARVWVCHGPVYARARLGAGDGGRGGGCHTAINDVLFH